MAILSDSNKVPMLQDGERQNFFLGSYFVEEVARVILSHRSGL